jgi:hypothetical protein
MGQNRMVRPCPADMKDLQFFSRLISRTPQRFEKLIFAD